MVGDPDFLKKKLHGRVAGWAGAAPSPDQARLFFAELRDALEKVDDQHGVKFPTIKTYCDWGSHSSLDGMHHAHLLKSMLATVLSQSLYLAKPGMYVPKGGKSAKFAVEEGLGFIRLFTEMTEAYRFLSMPPIVGAPPNSVYSFSRRC